MRIEVELGAGRALVRAQYRPGLAVRRTAVSAAVRAALHDAARTAARDAAPDAPLVAGRTTVSTVSTVGAARAGAAGGLQVQATYPRSLPVTAAAVTDAVHAALCAAATSCSTGGDR